MIGKTGWSKGKKFEKKVESRCLKCNEIFLSARRRKFCDDHPKGQDRPQKIFIKIEKTNNFSSSGDNGTMTSSSLRNKKRKFTEESKQKLSAIMKQKFKENPSLFMGGNRGRTRNFVVNGVNLQGKWEIEFYLWALKEGLNPIRYTTGFPYMWDVERTYYPDFFIPSLDLYVEVKGWTREKDRAKWKQFPHKLIVLQKKEIEDIRKGIFEGLQNL